MAGVAGAAGLAAAIFLFMRRRKQKKVINSSSKLLKYSGSGGTPRSRVGDMESGSIEDPPTHLFTYEELEEATDCFNENRELGDGGFGTVYKGRRVEMISYKAMLRPLDLHFFSANCHPTLFSKPCYCQFVRSKMLVLACVALFI